MNTTVIIVVALALVAVLALLSIRKKTNGSATKQEESKLTPVQEELLALAQNPGEDGLPLMFALTTCRHCKRTREFLDENGVVYHLLYVDEFTGKHRAALMDKVRSYNPRGSFPTTVLPGGKVVAGFREQILREALIHDTGVTAANAKDPS